VLDRFLGLVELINLAVDHPDQGVKGTDLRVGDTALFVEQSRVPS
jgi:hypothetical protein